MIGFSVVVVNTLEDARIHAAHRSCKRSALAIDRISTGTCVLIQDIAPDLPVRQGPHLRSSSKAVSKMVFLGGV